MVISTKPISKKLVYDDGYIMVKTYYKNGTNLRVLGTTDRSFYERMKKNLKKYPPNSFSYINSSNYDNYMIITPTGVWGSLRTHKDVRYVLAFIQTAGSWKKPLTLKKMNMG